MLDAFRSSSKLLKTFCGHTDYVWSIDYSTFDDGEFICTASNDNTICVWNIETNKQTQLSYGHSDSVYCVKFSPYHYHNHRRSVICSSSFDRTIRFCDIKDNQLLQLFNGHTGWIGGIEFSPFNGGQYLSSVSGDNTIRLWDVETSNTLHIFKGHKASVWCIDISPLQSNNNNDNNKDNTIGVIGGSGYTICSGSYDSNIHIWDIETTRQFILLKGHEGCVRSIKYGSNELGNTILSGSYDNSVRLWDIRSGQQIQVFNGHTNNVNAVEYSPFTINNIEIGGNSNVICSGSTDNTIRFWDIRSNKKELYIINGEDKTFDGIVSLKFLQVKKNSKRNHGRDYDVNLCYGSAKVQFVSMDKYHFFNNKKICLILFE
ncbi:hypothetical protein RFI_03327 [Reticulomyxa filosa]|uniref:Uncharacterized protein n=1 Tax=Reticulomyxa filosa TaxID=46433 RepID=X6P5E4_RETFI|nr:hypothetical protein RFI_03327 [Reticulomyxa filosa]|eukprot:ETO33775.1 hypothetical protein RFI_03327 [Reticulomyxa filosa]